MAAAGLHPSCGLRVQGWMFRVSGVGLGASGCRGSEFRPTVGGGNLAPPRSPKLL